jgi:hypothetical protein
MTAPAAMIAALPQYAIGDEIGSGGMGVVFAGVHRSLGRQVAIKQLPADMADRPGVSELFDREARVLASLDHPHIVPVYDYVQSGRDNLLVMERLDGGTVHSRFRLEGVSGEQACAIALAMLAGLHAAHRAGVLHLDVKPKNLLFTTQGVMKVADFGIAQVISEGATLVTHGGEVLGTPAYIAPEQAMGNALSPAADVYSAGTVLYELLSGELPFDNTRGAISMMRQHMFTDPRPISGVPTPLAGVVMRSLARELTDRYREAESFATDLAAAATRVFGPGWLERSGVPVLHLTPRVMASLAAPANGHRDERTFPVPVVPLSRNEVPDPTRSATRADLDREPPKPASALWPKLAASAALVVLAVVAFLTPATLPHTAAVNVTVDGAGIAEPVTVNLAQSITVAGEGAGSDPVNVTLSMSAAGVPLGSAVEAADPDRNGHFSADLELPAVARWIVGGAVTGEVRWSRAGQADTVQPFTLLTRQHPLASAMGTGSLLLGLFALAYLESGLRTIRHGHRWRSGRFGSPVLGALFGAAGWLFVSVLSSHEPSVPFALGCALAGALAAVFTLLATERSARR